VENKNNNPVNIRFVAKTSDIRNLSENITSDIMLKEGWGTCGPREYLTWPALSFSLPDLEYKITSTRSSMITRYLR